MGEFSLTSKIDGFPVWAILVINFLFPTVILSVHLFMKYYGKKQEKECLRKEQEKCNS